MGENETFKLKGAILKKPGFLEIMSWKTVSDKEIPPYKTGQYVELKSIRMVEGKVSATLDSFFVDLPSGLPDRVSADLPDGEARYRHRCLDPNSH